MYIPIRLLFYKKNDLEVVFFMDKELLNKQFVSIDTCKEGQLQLRNKKDSVFTFCFELSVHLINY